MIWKVWYFLQNARITDKKALLPAINRYYLVLVLDIGGKPIQGNSNLFTETRNKAKKSTKNKLHWPQVADQSTQIREVALIM